MFAVMSSRSLLPSVKKLNPFSNKLLLSAIIVSIAIQVGVIYFEPLQAIFKTVPLLAWDWIKIIGISALGFVIMEASKFFVAVSDKNSRLGY